MKIKDGFYVINLETNSVRPVTSSYLRKLYPSKQQIVVLKDNLFVYQMNAGKYKYNDASQKAIALARKFVEETM